MSRTKHRLNTKDDSHQEHKGEKATQVKNGRVRGEDTYSGDDLDECDTCKGLFPRATMRYYGGEIHCPRCYNSKGGVAPGGEGRQNMREQANTRNMVAMIGAAVGRHSRQHLRRRNIQQPKLQASYDTGDDHPTATTPNEGRVDPNTR